MTERPIYECVTPSDGTWKNRHKNARVTPAIPDVPKSLQSKCNSFCTEAEQVSAQIMTGNGGYVESLGKYG